MGPLYWLSLLYTVRWVLSLNPQPIDSRRLTGSKSHGSSCLHLPALGFEVCTPCKAVLLPRWGSKHRPSSLHNKHITYGTVFLVPCCTLTENLTQYNYCGRGESICKIHLNIGLSSAHLFQCRMRSQWKALHGSDCFWVFSQSMGNTTQILRIMISEWQSVIDLRQSSQPVRLLLQTKTVSLMPGS